MKCPKCHYLSFDPEPRCKNCGYDLEVADADLAFRAAEDGDQSVPDLPLRETRVDDSEPLTLELVRSTRLVHPDDAVIERPAPKRQRGLPRVPAMAGASRRPRQAPAPEPLAEAPAPAAPSASLRSELMNPARVAEIAAPAPLAFVPVDEAKPTPPPAPAAPVTPTAPAALKPLIPIVSPAPPPPAPAAPAPAAFVPLTIPAPVQAAPPAPVAPPAPAPAVPAPIAHAARTAQIEPRPEPRPDPPRPVAPPTTDLPLFVKETKGRETDLNLESPAEAFVRNSGGRPPLVVRRPADVNRPGPQPSAYVQRQDRRVGPLDNDLLEDLRRVEREEAAAARAAELAARASAGLAEEDSADEPVAPSQRLMAAAIDGLLLGGVGTFVLWATLRMTGVAASAFSVGAIVPLAIFLAGVGVSYLLMFTLAGGQTVGKMLAGIRVVPEDDPAERVSFRQAAARAFLAPMSMAVLGLGWFPALLGRVAIHDRLVHTRVVRA